MSSNKKVLQFFDSHQEADTANFDYYQSLTPDQRIEIGLELYSAYHEAYPRFERVYRVAELGECPVSSDWGVGIQPIRRT